MKFTSPAEFFSAMIPDPQIPNPKSPDPTPTSQKMPYIQSILGHFRAFLRGFRANKPILERNIKKIGIKTGILRIFLPYFLKVSGA